MFLTVFFKDIISLFQNASGISDDECLCLLVGMDTRGGGRGLYHIIHYSIERVVYSTCEGCGLLAIGDDIISITALTSMDEENSVATETSRTSGHLGDHGPHCLASVGGIHGNTSRTSHRDH